MTASRWRAALAGLAVLAGACGGGGEDAARSSGGSTSPSSPGSTSSAAATAPSTTAAAPVPDVLRFTAEAVGGGEVAGAAYAGRDVVLWFWAPW